MSEPEAMNLGSVLPKIRPLARVVVPVAGSSDLAHGEPYPAPKKVADDL